MNFFFMLPSVIGPGFDEDALPVGAFASGHESASKSEIGGAALETAAAPGAFFGVKGGAPNRPFAGV